MLDFNDDDLTDETISLATNEAIETAVAQQFEAPRQYLGASIAGGVCMRAVQYEWQVRPSHSARFKAIFERGHAMEALTKQQMVTAGFRFAPVAMLGFSALGGLFKGHADGILEGGPELPGLIYPAIFEHKCLGARGWRKLNRDGLAKAYPLYAAQVSLYQMHLNCTNPALFTATNADSCARLHALIPFDAARAQAWSDQAAIIIKATAAGELLPRFTDNPNDWRCGYCSHNARCWK